MQESELLYSTTDPHEIPLVMPGWARDVPALAKQIDDGYALRRSAGLPIDGTLPADQVAREARLREYYLFPYRAGIAPPTSASLLGSLITGV